MFFVLLLCRNVLLSNFHSHMSTSCFRLHPEKKTTKIVHKLCETELLRFLFMCPSKTKIVVYHRRSSQRFWLVSLHQLRMCVQRNKVKPTRRVCEQLRTSSAFLQMRRFIHKCLTISVEQEKVSFFSTLNSKKKKKTKTVAFVLCRKSYTHRSPFSNYFFNMKLHRCNICPESLNLFSVSDLLFTNELPCP